MSKEVVTADPALFLKHHVSIQEGQLCVPAKERRFG